MLPRALTKAVPKSTFQEILLLLREFLRSGSSVQRVAKERRCVVRPLHAMSWSLAMAAGTRPKPATRLDCVIFRLPDVQSVVAGSLAALASPDPRHTKAQLRHTKSEVVTTSAHR
jgi:hypothetical protein